MWYVKSELKVSQRFRKRQECVNNQWNCLLTELLAGVVAWIPTASLTTVNKATVQFKQPR